MCERECVCSNLSHAGHWLSRDGRRSLSYLPFPHQPRSPLFRAPAVLAGAPDAVMLADVRAPAVLALAPLAAVLALVDPPGPQARCQWRRGPSFDAAFPAVRLFSGCSPRPLLSETANTVGAQYMPSERGTVGSGLGPLQKFGAIADGLFNGCTSNQSGTTDL